MARCFRLGVIGISLMAGCAESPPPPPQAQPVPGGYAAYPPPAPYQPSDAVRRLAVFVNPPPDPNASSFRVTLIEHFVQRKAFKLRLVLSVLQAGYGENALEHGVKLDGVLLDTVEHLVAFRGVVGAGQGKGEPHARDRRA